MRSVKLTTHLHLMSSEIRSRTVGIPAFYSVYLDFKLRLNIIYSLFFLSFGCSGTSETVAYGLWPGTKRSRFFLKGVNPDAC